MSDFVPNNRNLQEVFIFFFHSKKTVAEAHSELQKVYVDAALSETTCRDWFRRFKDGDFDVDDRPREGRPKTFEDADVIYYELLKSNETITGERYRTQLMRLSRALREKRPQYEQRHEKVILQHDNARPYVTKPIKTLTWKRSNGKFYPTRQYSPDIAPSDYYLFRSMAHRLADQFRSYEDIEKCLDSWIASKDEYFYRNGIRALPERWAKVVAKDGQYFE